MNPPHSEAAIRKAADWRAFKRGTELVASVAEASASESGWRGTVRDGRKPLRVSVAVRSATDIEARCPCRDNQATGAFCAHAVAVGLFLASGKTGSSTPSAPTVQIAAREPIDGASWCLEFPPAWRRMLEGARLTLKISRVNEPPAPADDLLTGWLREMGSPEGGMIALDAVRLDGFLRAITDHPRIVCAGDRITVASGAVLNIASVIPDGGHVVITPGPAQLLAIHRLTADISQNRIALTSKPLPSECASLAHGKPAKLPLSWFLQNVQSLGEMLAWPEHGWLAGLHFIAAKPRISITFSAHDKGLAAHPLVDYPDSTPVVPVTGFIPELPKIVQNKCFVRDLAAEQAVIFALGQAGFVQVSSSREGLILSDEAKITEFLNEGIPWFQRHFTVVEGRGLAQLMREVSRLKPRVDIHRSGEDWLEFNLTFETNDPNICIDPAEVRRMLKSNGSLKTRQLARELEDLIEPLFSELDLQQQNGRFIARGASMECIQHLRKKLSNPCILNELNISKASFPESVTAKLRPYQLVGFEWIADRLNRFHGALLADDMGLGKTVQTIAAIEHMFSKLDDGSVEASDSILVVATTSLLGNWRAEFEKFAPSRPVRILHGSGREEEKERVGSREVWLTSYGTLARDLAWYLRQEFLAVVVDEASLMRNPDTDQAKALFKLSARHRLALTGTPIENGVRDLWSIFRFIQPGWLGGRRDFQERYENAGDAAALRRLRIKTAPFVLRRAKEEVAADLPAKIQIDEFVDLTHRQQAIYRELLIEGRRGVATLIDAKQAGAARMQMLTALLRLRQACCDLALLGNDRLKQLKTHERSAKLERLHELVDAAVAGGHRILVFSQFKTQLTLIRASLAASGIDALQLDGTTRNRQQLVDRFQSAEGPPVFLISLKAGGYGLNLTAADVVIHFDPWWNPAAESQASDRAHRIGQTRPVTVYRLLTRGTVEENVVRLQSRKRAIAASIDEAGAGDAAGWSEDELAALLK